MSCSDCNFFKKMKFCSRNSQIFLNLLCSAAAVTLRAKNIQSRNMQQLQRPADLQSSHQPTHVIITEGSLGLRFNVLCVIIARKREKSIYHDCYHGFYLNNRAGLQAIYQTLGFGTILGTNLEPWHDKHERNVHRTQMFFVERYFSRFLFLYDVLDWWVSDWAALLPNLLYCWFILVTIIKQKPQTESPNWLIQSEMDSVKGLTV